jgi:peptidoglycan/xylan/chitin deacetylase (PgdA/CDA1 family)
MILGYHEIVPTAQSYRYALTSLALDRHLELVGKLQTMEVCANASHRFTFDDGHVSNFRFALPLLTKHAVTGVFFAVGSYIGNRSDYLTWEQLKELASRGHEVQSHGWSHIPLTQCVDSRLTDELVRSKQTLEDRLQVKVEAISMPHGRWNPKVLEACARAGYARIFTSDPWIKPHIREGVLLAGRLVMNRTLSDHDLQLLLQEDRGAMLRLRLKQDAKKSMKCVLGDRLYHRIWCRFSGWDGPVSLEEASDSPYAG